MKVSKILLDYMLAVLCLIVLLFPLLFLFVISTLDTGQNGIFIQKRIGKEGKSFYLYKLRTMKGNYISSVTTNQMEITNFGRFLRRYKLDELPQILNIIKGDMSWVGPRPDIEGYADQLTGEDRIILSVKPGITGPAQLKYRNEEEILSQVENPQQYNDEVIWKDKVRINKKYVKNWSLSQDLRYLYKTVFS